MERLTAFLLIFVVPFFIVSCAVKKQKKSARLPASVTSGQSLNEADLFMQEIENAPSAKY